MPNLRICPACGRKCTAFNEGRMCQAAEKRAATRARKAAAAVPPVSMTPDYVGAQLARAAMDLWRRSWDIGGPLTRQQALDTLATLIRERIDAHPPSFMVVAILRAAVLRPNAGIGDYITSGAALSMLEDAAKVMHDAVMRRPAVEVIPAGTADTPEPGSWEKVQDEIQRRAKDSREAVERLTKQLRAYRMAGMPALARLVRHYVQHATITHEDALAVGVDKLPEDAGHVLDFLNRRGKWAPVLAPGTVLQLQVQPTEDHIAPWATGEDDDSLNARVIRYYKAKLPRASVNLLAALHLVTVRYLKRLTPEEHTACRYLDLDNKDVRKVFNAAMQVRLPVRESAMLALLARGDQRKPTPTK